MGRIFIIDTENVGPKSLLGLESLEKSDKLILVHSIHSFRLPITMINLIKESRCSIEIEECTVRTVNALDFVICGIAGELIGKGRRGPILIVSRDKGYDSMIEYYQNKNINMLRTESILSYINKDNNVSSDDVSMEDYENYMEEDSSNLRLVVKNASLKGIPTLSQVLLGYTECGALDKDKLFTIAMLIKSSKDKKQFFNSVSLAFEDNGAELYSKLKSYYERYKQFLNADMEMDLLVG